MNKKETKTLLMLILALILIDQIIKIIMLITKIQVFSTTGWGIGLEQNVTSDNNIEYILVNFIAMLLLIRYVKSNNSYIKKESKIILSFAIAGVVSNLIDRIWKGHVLNYISIPNFAFLNLAYIYIIVTWVGMAIMLTKYTIKRMRGG